MGLIVTNTTGAELDIDDLGLGLRAGAAVDLTFESNPVDVATSSVSGDLFTLVTAGDLVVKDPFDNSTDLSIADGLAALRSHNDTHFRMPAGGRIADAIDVDLSAPGSYLRFNGTTFERQTPAQVASEIESSINFENIQGGHDAWRIIDNDGDTYVRVQSDDVTDTDIIEFQTAFNVQMQIFDGQTNLIAPTIRFNGYPNTRDDGATTSALYVDASGILQYGSVTVDASTIDHSQLTNLTVGDPHTQYVKKIGDTMTGDLVIDGTAGNVDLILFNGADIEMGTGSQINAAIGTPTDPSITVAGDTNTGINGPANNVLQGIAGGTTVWEAIFTEFTVNTDIKFSTYPDTRDDGSTTKALYVDPTGELKYGPIDVEAGPLSTIQLGRSAGVAIPTSFVDVTWDQIDVENDITTLERDDTNTDNILIKETGLYLVTFNLSIDATAGEQTYTVRVRRNDTDVIPGSTRIISEDDEINDVSNVFFCECVAGDFITLQVQSSATGSVFTSTSTFGVTSLSGVKGDQGAPGTGTTVNVEDNNSTVPGGPHNTLNFIGSLVTATDGGGGTANITIDSPAAQDLATVIRRRTTQQALPAGTTTEMVYDITELANNTAVVAPGANPAKIVAQETGLYLYIAESEFVVGANTTALVELNTAVNGIALGGEWVRRVQVFADGSVPNQDRARDYHALPILLNAGEEISTYVTPTLQFGTGTIQTSGSATHSLIRLSGVPGAPGQDGSPGSGSTINVADEGTNVPNTPFSRLDFVGAGVTVTDGGAGTATVTIPGGGGGSATQHDRQMVSSSTIVSTTSQTFIDLSTMTLTSKDLGATGTYVVSFSSQVSQNGNGVPVDFRLVVNGTPLADSEISYVAGRNATANVDYGTAAGTWLVTGVTSGTVIKIQWKVEGNTGRVAQRRLVLDGILTSNVVA